MPSKPARPAPSPLAAHRRRMRQRGLRRVEVQVRDEDAALIRAVASALADPARADAARAALRGGVLAKGRDLKALLEAAPLEGLDLERSRDSGRDIEL